MSKRIVLHQPQSFDELKAIMQREQDALQRRKDMSDYISLLITLLVNDGLYLTRYAVKFKRDRFPEECYTCFLETEYREALKKLLPVEVQKTGEVVDVQIIEDVKIDLSTGGEK